MVMSLSLLATKKRKLLECLCKLGEQGELHGTLERELVALERKFSQREPIASGLRYLSSLAAPG